MRDAELLIKAKLIVVYFIAPQVLALQARGLGHRIILNLFVAMAVVVPIVSWVSKPAISTQQHLTSKFT